MNKIILIVLLVLSPSVFAFTCKTPLNEIGMRGGEADIIVPISSNIVAGKNLVVDLSHYITCMSDTRDPAWIDYIDLLSNGASLGSVFSQLLGGVMVQGRYHKIPVPKIRIYDMPGSDFVYIPLPISLYFEMPAIGFGSSIDFNVKKGDYLGSVKFIQTNNSNATQHEYKWNFYALNDANIRASVCSIQSGNELNVDLGQIERGDIVVNGTSRQTIGKSLEFYCESNELITFDMGVNMTPVSWNSSAIQTGSKNLGIVMRSENDVLNNSSVKKISISQGRGSFPFSFTPVKPAGVSSDDIPTGGFNASATLIFTPQ